MCRLRVCTVTAAVIADRKSTRLNSSHGYISYAVFCLKKKKKYQAHPGRSSSSKHITTTSRTASGRPKRQGSCPCLSSVRDWSSLGMPSFPHCHSLVYI